MPNHHKEELLRELLNHQISERDKREKVKERPLLTKDEYEREQMGLENQDFEQNISLRKCFSWAIYAFVVTFVFVELGIVSLSATECVSFHLSDAVLIALLTTMTTTIVGLLIFVVKYFFPNADKK